MIFLCLLRGINVGGKTAARMTDVKAIFESLGFRKVKTWLQSGNVLFESDPSGAKGIAGTIEATLAARIGGSILVLIRDFAEMDTIVDGNPLVKKAGLESEWLHVTFLREAKEATGIKELEKRKDPAERIVVRGREAYLYCPNGYGRTRLNNGAIEKALGTVATTRNWKTTRALQEMMRSMKVAADDGR
jgi:uncharacterized protein (DUF1697 family)